MSRSTRKLTAPDLGVLAAGLLVGIEREVFRRTGEAGFDDLRPRHGAVLAYLDEDGLRLADLARTSGRNKQTIAASVDELESLGYIRRVEDPADRRAKLIVPTDRGRQRMRLGDEIIAEIERRHEATLGPAAYARFVQALRLITANQAPDSDDEG
jgi:DNA-binding MarR family transcriptional regulator